VAYPFLSPGLSPTVAVAVSDPPDDLHRSTVFIHLASAAFCANYATRSLPSMMFIAMNPQFSQLNLGWNAEPNVPEPCVEIIGDDIILSFHVNPFRFKDF
jgi:hypothetical protein